MLNSLACVILLKHTIGGGQWRGILNGIKQSYILANNISFGEYEGEALMFLIRTGLIESNFISMVKNESTCCTLMQP